MVSTKQNKKTKDLIIPPVKSIPNITKRGFPIPQDEIDSIRHKIVEPLLFSFKFLDRQHMAFNLGRVEKSWFVSLLDVLKDVCYLSRHELIKQRQHYNTHGHKWDELEYKYPFGDDFLEQVECVQFTVTKSTGRVHGFIIGNRFYIVWLDPHHNLYPDERFGGPKFYQKQMNCYEELKMRHDKLEEDYNKLFSLLDKNTEPAKDA